MNPVISAVRAQRASGWGIADIGIKNKLTTNEVIAILEGDTPSRFRPPRVKLPKPERQPRVSKLPKPDSDDVHLVAAKSRCWQDKRGRQCARCGHYKLWEEFAVKAEAFNGHQSSCRQCVSEQKKESRARNPATRPRGGQVKTRIDDNGRVCTVCNTYKAWEHYGKRADTKTGYFAMCQVCDNARSRERTAVKQKEKNARIKELHSCGIAIWQIAEELDENTARIRAVVGQK